MKKVICKECKEVSDFHYHECERGIAEYYGCTKCDNWCGTCRPDWNPKSKSYDKLSKSTKNRESKVSSKNVQKKQSRNNKRTKK